VADQETEQRWIVRVGNPSRTALLKLTAGPQRQLSVTPSGVLDLEPIAAAVRSSIAADAAASLFAVVENTVTAQGGVIEPAPVGDVSGTFTLRLDDLFAVSEIRAEHEVAEGVAADLGDRMHDAVLRAFQKMLHDKLASARGLIEQGKIGAAVVAASEALMLSGTSAAELSALFKRIDRQHLALDERTAVLKFIVASAGAMKSFSPSLAEAVELEQLSTDPTSVRRLRLFRANAFAEDRLVDAAAVLYEHLIRDKDCEADTRAWALHGLALIDPRDSAAASLLHERAGDAFMEAGCPREAANDYLVAATVRRHREPGRALALIERVLAFFVGHDPMSLEERASLLHSRAQILAARGRSDEALASVSEAVALRTGLTGNEEQRSASLNLASELALAVGNHEQSTLFRDAADSLAAHFVGNAAIRHRVAKAYEAGNTAEVEAARQAGVNDNDDQLVALCDIYLAVQGLGSFEERIAVADRARARVETAQLPEADAALVAATFAELYRQNGDEARALKWYLRVHDLTPEHPIAARQALRLLFKQQRWAEAVAVLETQLSLHGDRLDLLVGLANALISSGRPHDGMSAATRARALARTLEQERAIGKVMERAALVMKTVPDQSAVSPRRVTTLRDLEENLLLFRLHVEADQRMEFWQREKKSSKSGFKPSSARTPEKTTQPSHAWRPEPERTAKAILWSFLHGRLPGVEILHEVPAGPGRIDLFLRLEGGERVVVELKMLGNGYSSTYAAEGFDQLCEYMDAKSTAVGYLVAFDARARDQGKQLPRTPEAQARSLYLLMVDVTPVVKKTAVPSKIDRKAKSTARRQGPGNKERKAKPTKRRRGATGAK
jgi:tetratricopeptide (TPR) repeat protein